MAVGIWRGVGNVARKVKKEWRGVGNVARNIKKEWRGVGNVARLCFSNGLVLYDYGNAPYGVNLRSCVGSGTVRGVIGSDSVYLNTTSYLGDTKGNSGLDSSLLCPPFYIICQEIAQNIDNFTKVRVTVNISAFLSTTGQREGVKISVGGYWGQTWNDEGYIEDTIFWRATSYAITSTGLCTLEFELTNDIKNKIKSYDMSILYFGAYTNIKDGSDYAEWYCNAAVYFHRIEFC